MAYQHLTVKIRGVPPGMLQHNGRLANPLDPIVQEIAKLTKKRNKTYEDIEKVAKLEWYGGLYLDDRQRVIIPADWLEGMFVAAAKRGKQGKEFKAGLMIPESPPLLYDGPEDIDELWECKRFADTRKARIKSSSVMRTRPLFAEWRLKFTVAYEPSVLNADTLIEYLRIAALYVGLSDNRPRFGRFVIEEVKPE